MGLSRGGVVIAACRSADYVAREVARQYKAQEAMDARSGAPVYLDNIDLQFSDGETCVRLDRSVKGCDAFLIQALLDPTSERCVDENYMAFLVAARALREWGAEHVTAVLPYLAYARQDKPSRGQREPTTAKLTADLAIEAGIDRLVTWHPHSPRVSGFYDRVSVDILDPLPLFVAEFNRFWSRDDVIVVAPDAGAYELVKRFSQALNLKSAVASKRRPRPEENRYRVG
jgi:ribose-phosphate pyrophosphokinase